MPAGQQDIRKAKENEAVELMKVGTKKKRSFEVGRSQLHYRRQKLSPCL